MTQVADALMPILCSIEPQATPLRVLAPVASSIRYFGTTNRLMPRTPGGASGSFASTRWMMFSVMSCSPAEMKILVPVMRYVPSAAGSALVRMRPRSVPQCGSVKFIVPDHSPLIIFGR